MPPLDLSALERCPCPCGCGGDIPVYDVAVLDSGPGPMWLDPSPQQNLRTEIRAAAAFATQIAAQPELQASSAARRAAGAALLVLSTEMASTLVNRGDATLEETASGMTRARASDPHLLMLLSVAQTVAFVGHALYADDLRPAVMSTE